MNVCFGLILGEMVVRRRVNKKWKLGILPPPWRLSFSHFLETGCPGSQHYAAQGPNYIEWVRGNWSFFGLSMRIPTSRPTNQTNNTVNMVAMKLRDELKDWQIHRNVQINKFQCNSMFLWTQRCDSNFSAFDIFTIKLIHTQPPPLSPIHYIFLQALTPIWDWSEPQLVKVWRTEAPVLWAMSLFSDEDYPWFS